MRITLHTRYGCSCCTASPASAASACTPRVGRLSPSWSTRTFSARHTRWLRCRARSFFRPIAAPSASSSPRAKWRRRSVVIHTLTHSLHQFHQFVWISFSTVAHRVWHCFFVSRFRSLHLVQADEDVCVFHWQPFEFTFCVFRSFQQLWLYEVALTLRRDVFREQKERKMDNLNSYLPLSTWQRTTKVVPIYC